MTNNEEAHHEPRANGNAVREKTPTIHDVAAKLGMHKSTVSLALSGKGNIAASTRERVAQAAEALGYQPHPLAQRLANGGNNRLVCLCSGDLDVGLSTEKILLIQKALCQQSLEAPIYTFSNSSCEDAELQAAQIAHLCRQQPRALVCAAHSLHPESFRELAAYQRRGGTVVSYDVPVEMPWDQVVFDREDNAYRAARYLIERGHRHIGLAMSNATMGLASELTVPQGLRLKGFRRALEEAHLPMRNEWVFQHSTYEVGGAELARRFLALPKRPTGMCIVNDYVVLSFMVELARARLRVPEDVSIIGHDNQPVANYCMVPLTSISQPVEAIAQSVVERLLDRVRGNEAPPQTIMIRGSLVERQSVCPPSLPNVMEPQMDTDERG